MTLDKRALNLQRDLEVKVSWMIQSLCNMSTTLTIFAENVIPFSILMLFKNYEKFNVKVDILLRKNDI